MKQIGTTLTELLATLAVVAVLLASGVPAIASLARSASLTGATNDLLGALQLARSEAIKRNSRAVVCASANGSSCTMSGGWHLGWMVFHDVNNNAARDEGEAMLHCRGALPQGFSVKATSSLAYYISFASTGGSKLTSGALQFGNLVVCSGSGAGKSGRKIVVSSTGRWRTEKLGACL